MADRQERFPFRHIAYSSLGASIFLYAGVQLLKARNEAVRLHSEAEEQERVRNVKEFINMHKDESIDKNRSYMISGILLKNKGTKDKDIYYRLRYSFKKE